MSMKSLLIACVLATLTFGCAGKERVVFVTSTNLGLNVDATTNSASIAYDRIEGYFAPTYENGALPPVVGSIEVGGDIFTPEIRQVYATGHAAELATAKTPSPEPRKPLLRRRDGNAFFGTSTTLGLNVTSAAGGAPISMNFGFRRKEASILPLGHDPVTEEDKYPSVLASIDNVTHAGESVGLDNQQFFATGFAAENLAQKDAIRDVFTATSLIALRDGLTNEQIEEAIKQGEADAQTDQQKLNELIGVLGSREDFAKDLSGLVAASEGLNPNQINQISAKTTSDALRTYLRGRPSHIEILHNAIPTWKQGS
ncbi:hypothetical protein QMT40_000234 [Parvibaculaceae bacterium PLY_AMNH_Bact1]|nr:hypothetical protein QMT40_000234 [Parvibaculaceae bacterium PLY_AMNH_Bact1]